MTSAALKPFPQAIVKADAHATIFIVTGRGEIAIRAGTSLGEGTPDFVGFGKDFPVRLPELEPGRDYYVSLDGDLKPVASVADGLPGTDVIGGFHFAPGGNATARAGGDSEPAINPYSCWDLNFRPACQDPRGMTLVDMQDGGKFWVDIYKLGIDHKDKGTSRFGETIADGDDLPQRVDGEGRGKVLDYPTACAIYAHHGKQLLSYDEFRAAAFGVTEKTAAGRDPKVTGLDAPRTSQRGLMQATGNLWDWGHDGDPELRRASLFGGSWWLGGNAGSRYASLDSWPGHSYDSISARGRSDHLQLA